MLHLTAQNFDTETYNSTAWVIVMFYANWCGKCAMMKLVFEDLAKKYRSQIKFFQVDIESSPSLAQKYQTDIVPAFFFFKNGQIEAAFDGIINEKTFDIRIQKIFRNC